MSDLQNVVDQNLEFADDEKGLFSQLLRVGAYAATFNDYLPPWWSIGRDAAMRKMIADDGGFLSGLTDKAATKLANIPIKVVPKDVTIQRHRKQADDYTYRLTYGSESGQGLYETISKFVVDALTQDNGGFMEVVAAGKKSDPVNSMVVGLKQLDAARCTRTGDSRYPVQYLSARGYPVNYHYTRIIYFSQLPSSMHDMFGVGHCAYTRSVRVAKDLFLSLNAKAEKKGARPASRIITAKNMSGQEIIKSIVAAEELMRNLGLDNYARTIALGGQDVEIDVTDLKDLDGIDYSDEIRTGLYSLAYIWGMEAIELFPVTGSRANDQVAFERARSMLPLWYIQRMKIAQAKILPPHLEFEIDHADSAHDHQQAVIADIVARGAVRRISSGVSTPWAERVKMIEQGHMTREVHANLSRRDGIAPNGDSITSVLVDSRYADLVFIPPNAIHPSLFDGDATPYIQANIIALQKLLGGRGAGADRARDVIAALEKVALLYNSDDDEEPERNAVTNRDTQRAETPPQIKEQHDGTAIVLRVPFEIAENLVVDIDVPVPPVDMHITLYHVKGIDDDLDYKAFLSAVEAFPFSPITGVLEGVGNFPDNGSGYPVFMFLNSPSLATVRENLIVHLEHAGYERPGDRGFIPHMTLGYSKSPLLPDVESTQVTFDSLFLFHKDERLKIRG